MRRTRISRSSGAVGTIAALLMVVGIAACGPGRDESVPTHQVGSAAFEMPALRLAYMSRDVDLSPTALYAPPAVGNNGSVLMTTHRLSDFRLVVVDSTGNLVARFGPTGEGPGELRGPRPVGFIGDTAVVYDLAQLQVSMFDRAGEHVATVPIRGVRGIPLALLDDQRALIVLGGRAGSRPGVMSLEDGSIERTVAESDTTAARLQEQVTSEGRQLTIGWWAGGALIADGIDYELALYDGEGRLVRVITRDVRAPRSTEARADADLRDFRSSPPGRRASESELLAKHDELLNTPLPHFSHTKSLGTDGAGRLWVLGQAADSGYADVFSPEGFLSRIDLACPAFSGGWSVRGHWLAVTCASTDLSYQGDAVLHLYRIE